MRFAHLERMLRLERDRSGWGRGAGSSVRQTSLRLPLAGSIRVRAPAFQMTAMGVRHDKAALSSGCKAHPATAPAGSNRSRRGGDEMSDAFG